MICSGTHHLRVVGIEGLFIQGEFLWTEGVVQLNHLRKLQSRNKQKVRHHYLSSGGWEKGDTSLSKLHLCSRRDVRFEIDSLVLSGTLKSIHDSIVIRKLHLPSRLL